MYFNIICFLLSMLSIFMIALLNLTINLNMNYILEYNMYNFNFLFELKLYFYMDYLANIFCLFVLMISSTCFYFSKFYMKTDKKQLQFMIFTLLFVFSMILVIFSLNFFTIMIGWDGLGITSYMLIIHYQTSSSNYSGMTTILTNRLGDSMLIITLWLSLHMFSLDMNIINNQTEIKNMTMALIIFSAMTKSAQFPFNTWLPLAMAAPTPISALVHSSTLVTAGLYMLIRMNSIFKNSSFFNKNLIIFPLLTLILASISNLKEMDIKKIIAYSTLSQLGLMMSILMMGDEMLTFFHILTHALYKAILFFCCGIFIHENLNNQDLRNFNQILKTNPYILSMFFISSLSLMGAPFMSGFYSKDMILEFMFSMNFNLFFIFNLFLATIMTSLYSFRILIYLLMINKSNLKFMLNMEWSKIYNSLFFLFSFMILSGSMLNWMLMEKFNMIYLKYNIKMLSMLLLLTGITTSFYTPKFLIKNLFLLKILSMQMLTQYQGYICSNISKKSNIYYFNSEFILEHLMIFSINLSIHKIYNYMKLIKFLNLIYSFYALIMMILILA